ncbi:MAG: SPFH domain-containing protein [bacterium]|nr:SPFH domain-containing protein [bacterium]
MDESIPLLIGIVVLIILFYFFYQVLRIVPQYQRLVILSLGQYAGTRGPGVVFVIPFIERAVSVDIRERFLDIPALTAITQDNAPISIDFLVYYRIVEPHLSVLEIENVVSATINMATTIVRAVIGDIVLDSVLSKREQINDTLRIKLDEVTERWGIKVTNVEIREIVPPRNVQEAMNRQMTAERERRASVTKATGERESSILEAEGVRQADILRAEGKKQSAILEAEGERQAQLLRAQGFSKALESISESAKTADKNTILLQYLELLKVMGNSPNAKFVLPMEISGMMEQVVSLLDKKTE